MWVAVPCKFIALDLIICWGTLKTQNDVQNSITAAVATELVRTSCCVAKGIKVVTQLTLSWDCHRRYKWVQGSRNGFLRGANVQDRSCYTLSHTAASMTQRRPKIFSSAASRKNAPELPPYSAQWLLGSFWTPEASDNRFALLSITALWWSVTATPLEPFPGRESQFKIHGKLSLYNII